MYKGIINPGEKIPSLEGNYMIRLFVDDKIVVSPLPISALKKRLKCGFRDSDGEYYPLYDDEKGALKKLIIENPF